MFIKIRNLGLASILMLILSSQFAHSFPWSYDMWEQPAIQPYEQPLIYPQNSVTTDGTRLKPQERAELEMITENPLPATNESINKGQELFKTYCAVCHGPNAKGNGVIVTKGHGFYPVDLTSKTVAQRTDGFIYAYILYGGKVMMPAYGESVSGEDAWNIINYVRSLQGQPSNTTAQENKQ